MLLAALLAVLAVPLAGCQRRAVPHAQDGVLDLRGTDLAARPIKLSGAWELYGGVMHPPARFLPAAPGDTADRLAPDQSWVPHRLPDGRMLGELGAATLRLRVLLPEAAADADAPPIALKVTTRGRAYRLYARDASGRALCPPLAAGALSLDRAQLRGTKLTQIAALLAPAPAPQPTVLELTLHLGNTYAPRRADEMAVLLGSEPALREGDSAEQQIQLLLIGSSLVIGLYHLSMFLVRRGERAPLFFGLFCLSLAARQFVFYGFPEQLTRATLPPGVAWDRQLRVEFCCLFWAVPLFCLYLRALFPEDFSPRVLRAILLVATAFSLVVLWPQPLAQARWTVTVYEVLTALTGLYTVWGMARVLRRGAARDQQTARFIAAGTLLLVLAAVNDILRNKGLLRTVTLESYGMFAFIFCQAFVLAVNNARARLSAERLAAELDQKNAALSRLDQMKDEFLANTSHELRTPLSGMLGLAEGLLAGERLSARAREHLRLIVASGRRLGNLVNDILDFAKLRYDHVKLQSRPVDLRAVVDLVLAMARPLAAGKKLELTSELPAPTPEVLADENRCQQILTNLVGNAVKFTPEGRVTVTAEVRGTRLAVTVSDTGIGIPAAEHARIFDAFSQVDGSAERAAGGTGLGLTITRKLVELHGGEIAVRSVPGQGSHFTFTLPLAAPAPMSAQGAVAVADAARRGERDPASGAVPVPIAETDANQSVPLFLEPDGTKLGPPSEPPPAGPPSGERASVAAQRNDRFRVLVVDDDPVNRAVLGSQLSGVGYEVREASSGAAALERVEREHFDAIVLDVMMPKMSGYEVLTRLRARHPASELPVLLLTAKNQEQDIAEGFRVGTNDYLTKPFSRTELLSRIQTHITLAKTHLAYGRFVPHEFIQLLGKEHVVYVDIGDHVLLPRMTILFCDVRGFTPLAESLDARGVFALLGGLLQRVSPVLRRHGGFIDKFIGDAVMGLFPTSPADAAAAAVQIQKEVLRYAESAARGAPLTVGIGVHTGATMLGTIGDADRMEATVLSDAVNLAARLEGLTRLFGVGILISEDALAQIAEPAPLAPRALGLVRVKGKKQPIGVHELAAGDPAPLAAHKAATRAAFAAALAQYQRGDLAAAGAGFQAIVEAAARVGIEDGPARLYAEQSARHAPQPLPPGWDGCLEFTVK